MGGALLRYEINRDRKDKGDRMENREYKSTQYVVVVEKGSDGRRYDICYFDLADVAIKEGKRIKDHYKKVDVIKRVVYEEKVKGWDD